MSACLEGKNKPKYGTDLCDAVLERWEHGSRQRQVMRQATYAFLRWGVERGHLKPFTSHLTKRLTSKRRSVSAIR